MTGDSAPESERRDWRRWELGLPEGVADAELTSAILSKLGDCDFAPTETQSAAICALLGESSPGWWRWEARERELLDRLSQLESIFFELPVDERRRAIESLRRESESYPHLRNRLDELTWLVRVVRPQREFRSADAELLAEKILKLLALRRHPRSELRRQFDREVREDRPRWQEAVRGLRSDWPELFREEEIWLNSILAKDRTVPARRRGSDTSFFGRHSALPGLLFIGGTLISLAVALIYSGTDREPPVPSRRTGKETEVRPSDARPFVPDHHGEDSNDTVARLTANTVHKMTQFGHSGDGVNVNVINRFSVAKFYGQWAFYFETTNARDYFLFLADPDGVERRVFAALRSYLEELQSTTPLVYCPPSRFNGEAFDVVSVSYEPAHGTVIDVGAERFKVIRMNARWDIAFSTRDDRVFLNQLLTIRKERLNSNNSESSAQYIATLGTAYDSDVQKLDHVLSILEKIQFEEPRHWVLTVIAPDKIERRSVRD